jgi:hypothetical protein
MRHMQIIRIFPHLHLNGLHSLTRYNRSLLCDRFDVAPSVTDCIKRSRVSNFIVTGCDDLLHLQKKDKSVW